MMQQIGIAEALWLVLIALIKFGIPIIFAIWVIRILRRISSSQTAIQNKLDAIETRLNTQ